MNAKVFLSIALLATVWSQPSTLRAQGSAFTYQGRLRDEGGMANGRYDLRFTIYDASAGGSPLAGPLTNAATSVSNGLFTATLNFGADVFTGANRWLEIAVRTNGGGGFSALIPRQPITPVPQAIFAQAASNLHGAITLGQLPGAVLTNSQRDVSLHGTFSGNGSGLTDIRLTGLSTAGPNRIQSIETAGNEQLNVHAWRFLDIEANLDANFWSGRDFLLTAEHDIFVRARHDATFTVDNSLAQTVGMTYQLTAGLNFNVLAGANLSLSANNLFLRSDGGATVNVASHLNTSIGGNAIVTVGNDLFAQANNLVLFGSKFALLPTGAAGFGTPDPQANLHVYGANTPTVLRVQSSGTPGFGRLEFLSDPQGSANEWRPGYIQSSDNGGFTGGLSFVVNGTGAGSRFGEIETMRIVNGRVGIGTATPANKLDVVGGPSGNGVQGTSSDPNASGVYGENMTGAGYGIAGRTIGNGTAVYGENVSAGGWAGYFIGNVRVTGTINPPSDRNVKRDFRSVDPRAVLEKVSSLEIQSWAYTNDASGTRHLGPVAQDFRAAFGLGADDKSIATVDADGVALAAIQGLNQKVEELRDELKRRDAVNAELKIRLAALEKQIFNFVSRTTEP